MDYEKAYKESFEAAKGLHDAGNALTKKQMEIVFPQLAESEDERIRTRFIEYFQGFLEGNEDCYKDGGYVRWEGLDVKRILAWLEKQKEQKPAEWSEEDRLHYANVLEALEYVKGCKSDYDKIEAVKSDIAWFKSLPKRFNLQPKQEWNKKDENKLYQVIDTLLADKAEALRDNPHCKALHEAFDDMIDWLKSLRPVSKESLQPHWKPSEEQMKALLKVVDKARELHYTSIDGYDGYNELRSLYEQIKKLM